MAMSIFEEIMGESRKLAISENRREVKENARKISVKNIKVESLRIFEDDEFDAETSFEVPEEVTDGEVVLVVDPEAETEDDIPEDVAEEMVGDMVFKCPICGSNYLCDCDHAEEAGIIMDEDGTPVECPVCGDEAEQILVGEIAPAEEVEPEEEITEKDLVDIEDNEDKEEVFEEEEEEFKEESVKLPEKESITEDTDLDWEEEETIEDAKEECPECEEAEELNLIPEVIVEKEEEKEEAPTVEIKDSDVNLYLDDTKFESLMNSVIKENYKGNAQFKVKRVASRNGKLKVEYIIREGKKITKGRMIGEGFKTKRIMSLNFRDRGAFTESYSKKPAFVIECVKIKNAVIPTKVTYDYKVKVNENMYRVSGNASTRKSFKK